MVSHGGSDPADQELSPKVECSARSSGSMGKHLRIHLNQTYSNPPESKFWFWSMCAGLYTRICCILVTFWRLSSICKITSMCSNANCIYNSGATDKQCLKHLYLIHLDQSLYTSQGSRLSNHFPIFLQYDHTFLIRIAPIFHNYITLFLSDWLLCWSNLWTYGTILLTFHNIWEERTKTSVWHKHLWPGWTFIIFKSSQYALTLEI